MAAAAMATGARLFITSLFTVPRSHSGGPNENRRFLHVWSIDPYSARRDGAAAYDSDSAYNASNPILGFSASISERRKSSGAEENRQKSVYWRDS
jgi:hypothetical protein